MLGVWAGGSHSLHSHTCVAPPVSQVLDMYNVHDRHMQEATSTQLLLTPHTLTLGVFERDLTSSGLLGAGARDPRASLLSRGVHSVQPRR